MTQASRRSAHRTLHLLLAAALSGVLLVAAFPPWNLLGGALIFVALLPFCWAITRATTLRESLTVGLVTGYVMSILGFTWVAYTLERFGNLPAPVAWVGLALFGFIGEPQFVLLSGAAFATRNVARSLPSFARPLYLAALYTAIDSLVPKLFADTLGHATHSMERLRQVADLGGVGALTFLIAWIQFQAIEERSRRAAIRVALALAATWGYGAWRLEDIRTYQAAHLSQSGATYPIALIQANIGDFEKLASEQGVREAGTHVIETFTRLSDQALALEPRPQAIVWPETAYPSTFRAPQSRAESDRDSQVEAWVNARKIPLFFGGYDHFRGKDHNAFFFLQPMSTASPTLPELQTYRKSLLLLFGEYLPLSDTFPQLKAAFPQVGNFGRGPGPQVLDLTSDHPGSRPPVLAQPLICYEVLFSDFVLEGARQGARFLLNITNDSWFGPWAEPELHLALSIFRSIETRLPLVRSTNTGISAVVLPDGSITERTELFKPAIVLARTPLYMTPKWTLIKAWGNWFWPLCAIGVALALGSFAARTTLKQARRKARATKSH